jgi:hypothetical protein
VHDHGKPSGKPEGKRSDEPGTTHSPTPTFSGNTAAEDICG